MDSILPWSTSAITIMPFFATSDLSALLTSSNDLSDEIVTRSPVKEVFEAADLSPTLAMLTMAPKTTLRKCDCTFIC